MLTLLDLALTYKLRLMLCITAPRQFLYKKRYQQKATVDTVTDPEPQRVLVSRLQDNESIEIYEYDSRNFCLYIPKSLGKICKDLLKRKYVKIQESDFELVLAFPRSKEGTAVLMTYLLPKLTAKRCEASQPQLGVNTIRPGLRRIILFRRRPLTRIEEVA